jgi:TfoX/Sxy family transcriptional regulator of competence genes
MAGRPMPPFGQKSPPELLERFEAVTDRFEGLERRKMFGFPAAFVGGNMVTGLMGERWHVRLSDEAASELLAMPGAGPFEAVEGRPMRGYYVLPASVLATDEEVGRWVERAVDFGRTLPLKKK